MNFVITEKGRTLLAQIIQGSTLTFTKAEASAEYSQKPTVLLSVQNKKQDVQIESVASEDDKVQIKLLVTNVNVSEEYLMKQLGIYAKTENTEEDVLMLVGQDALGETIPAKTDRIVEFYHTLTINTSNAYSVEVSINSSDLATKGLVQEELKKRDEENEKLSERINENKKNSKVFEDDITGEKMRLGIENGHLYIEKVTE